MAKRAAYLLVGLPHGGGTFLTEALRAHEATLEAAGIRQPARSSDEMFRAAVEIRRDHKSWGLRRRDVEGAWSGVCRRAYPGKDDVVAGHDLLAGATHGEIALLVDRLPGFDVHVVVVAGPADPRLTLFPDDHDLGDVLTRWAAHVRSPDRVHLIVAEDPASTWAALGRVVGFDADRLPLPEAVAATTGRDLASLRVLAGATGSLATSEELREAAEAWAKAAAEGGYDVHGDLTGLHPREGLADDDSARAHLELVGEVLADAVAELTRLREQHAELAEHAAKLQKKRKKLKQRLADLTA
jgi:hypothetical protein